MAFTGVALRAVLLDLDGVLYVGEDPVPGAQAAVAALRDARLTLRFVTNTTARSRAATVAKLRRLGFPVGEEEVVTPAALAVAHCRARGHRRVCLLVADEVKADFAELAEASGHEHADAVIVGDLGDAFGYEPLNRAFRHLIGGAELVALQRNRCWMTPDGLSLDAGAFVAALEFAADTHAFVVGKPAPGFFAAVLADAGVEAGTTMMVGDDVESDVGGALDAGLAAAVLVRTGKFRQDRRCASGIAPTAIVDSIADVPALLAASSSP